MAWKSMESFETNDNVTIKYLDSGSGTDLDMEKPVLILLHGFTGSSLVWQRNIPLLSQTYRIIAPDLRGHGLSSHSSHGFHVSRLAMDLHQLLAHLKPTIPNRPLRAIGGSLGCSILWCYTELFTTMLFSHMIFVDQSPLQNHSLLDSDGWDERFCNRAMNSEAALAGLQATLATAPETAHRGTIAACLAYRSHPDQGPSPDNVSDEKEAQDEAFFLGEAMRCEPEWLGRLMADHTSLDWRASIAATFGPASGSVTKVLVVASERSGCFPAAGPMKVVDLVNGGGSSSREGGDTRDDGPGLGKVNEGGRREALARGEVVDWGGHWCYWEDPRRFDSLCLDFLKT